MMAGVEAIEFRHTTRRDARGWDGHWRRVNDLSQGFVVAGHELLPDGQCQRGLCRGVLAVSPDHDPPERWRLESLA